MSNINSSSLSGRSASGGSFASSATSGPSTTYDLPQRVATSHTTTSAVRRHRARHLSPAYPYSDDFDKNFQDWVYDWADPPDCEMASKLIEYIRTEYNLPIPKGTPVQEVGAGVFNKVFALRTLQENNVTRDPQVMDKHALPEIVVLRIGWPLAPKLKIESDVATMTFARREAGLPVPRVFWYDSSASNPWELEWSIMEYVDGTVFQNAGNLWNNPTCATMKKLAELIAGHCNRLTTCRNFDKIGSLYFSDWDWNTCGSMGIDGYVVGPSVEIDFWGASRAYYTTLDRGPFDSVEAYMSALAEVHIRDAQNVDIPDGAFDFVAGCDCSVGKASAYSCRHLKKLRGKYLKLAKNIQTNLIPAAARKAELAARADGYTGTLGGCGAVLWHHDLHYGNIFISRHAASTLTEPETDGPAITALIDWEQMKIAPRGLHQPVPKVASSFSFNKEDRGGFPTGEMMFGPSLKDLFEGYAQRTSMYPKVFDPPAESAAPWAVASLNITVMIIRLSSMNPGDIEWWVDALEYLGFPQDDDYGAYSNDDDNSDNDDKNDDESSGEDAGSASSRSCNDGHQDQEDNHGGREGGDDRRQEQIGDSKGKYTPPRGRACASHAAWNPMTPRPFSAEEFLKRPILPQPAGSSNHAPAETEIPSTKDSKKVCRLLAIDMITPEAEFEIPLTPCPSGSRVVQTEYDAGLPMQIRLQLLVPDKRNDDGSPRLRPHSTIPPLPWIHQATQAPIVAPRTWLPTFFSLFVYCH